MTSKKFKHTSLEKWDTLDNCSSCSLPSNGSFLHFQAFILAMIFSFNGLPPEPEYSTCLISEKHPNTSLVTYPLWKFNHQKSVFWKREKCLSQKLHFFSLIQKKKKKTLPLFAFKLDILLNSSNTPFITWIDGRSVKTTKSSVKQRWVNCKRVGIYVG